MAKIRLVRQISQCGLCKNLNVAALGYPVLGAGPKTAMTPEGLHLKSLQDTMSELGHHWVDILKVDIEGKDFRVDIPTPSRVGMSRLGCQGLPARHRPWHTRNAAPCRAA